uniref:Putative membrane protein YOL092W n=1 Tax=Anthurium amnicola TaxID=1678845 RepID=A0A1D1Z3J3_9ARAE
MFRWLGEFLHNDSYSAIAGYVSIACWFVVLLPQLWAIYKTKSSDSVSITFVCLWLAGDLLNLAGSVLQHLLFTMIILAVYYCIADLVLFCQLVYYRNHSYAAERTPLLGEAPPSRRPSYLSTILKVLGLTVIACAFGALLCYYISSKIQHESDHSAHGKRDEALEFLWLPQVLGWGSAFLYLGSRIPQIFLNFCNKSCEGLSLAMFGFSVLGNVAFVLSVLFHSTDPTYLLINLSWLVGSGGTLTFDFIIFFQFYIYSKEWAAEI